MLVNGQDQDRKASSQARAKSIDFSCLYDFPIILVFVLYFHFISTFYMYIVTTIFIGKKIPDKYMLSGCELIDTENISLPSQNMKFVGE